MSFGKYSPTVSHSYQILKEWWNLDSAEIWGVDSEGYDSYGYMPDDGVDRAGNTENDYICNTEYNNEGEMIWSLYDETMWTWGNRLTEACERQLILKRLKNG